MAHVALMPCHLPAARIDAIDASAALAMPGVIDVVTGAELAAAIDPLMNGLDTPNVRRYPLAVGQVRYAGEWVCAVIAESRAIAEDAIEKIRLETTALPFVLDPEQALRDDSPQVHPDHHSNVLLDKKFVWGPVDDDFAAADHQLSFCVTWGRNSTVRLKHSALLPNGMRGSRCLIFGHRCRCQNMPTRLPVPWGWPAIRCVSIMISMLAAVMASNAALNMRC